MKILKKAFLLLTLATCVFGNSFAMRKKKSMQAATSPLKNTTIDSCS